LSHPILSICIPTNNRVDILRKTLNSIFEQEISTELFEVCVSDNSRTDETKTLIQEEFAHIPNLTYNQSSCEGFLNSIEALRLGKGILLKLHNDYSMFNENALGRMIDIAITHANERPLIFFSMGTLKIGDDIQKYKDFNTFLYSISYWSTWSSAFSVWKTDFDDFESKHIPVDHMFPHTSVLFYLVHKDKYLVDDFSYVTNLELKKKGGYNLIDNFNRIYLSMVHDLLERRYIEKNTYDKIETAIIKFSASWYSIVKIDKRYSFTFSNKSQIIRQQSGLLGVVKFYSFYILYHMINLIKMNVKRIIKA